MQFGPILKRGFYERPTVEVARDLLGKVLVHGPAAGIIVEAEAYLGGDDLASHSSRGITDRTRVIFGPPGHAYVYVIYGMYECLNLCSRTRGAARLCVVAGARTRRRDRNHAPEASGGAQAGASGLRSGPADHGAGDHAGAVRSRRHARQPGGAGTAGAARRGGPGHAPNRRQGVRRLAPAVHRERESVRELGASTVVAPVQPTDRALNSRLPCCGGNQSPLPCTSPRSVELRRRILEVIAHQPPVLHFPRTHPTVAAASAFLFCPLGAAGDQISPYVKGPRSASSCSSQFRRMHTFPAHSSNAQRLSQRVFLR